MDIKLGWSKNANSYKAGTVAASKAMEGWQKNTVNLALVFASAYYNQYKVISGIKEKITPIPIIGCSSPCVITPEGPAEKGVIVSLISASPETLQYSWALGKDVNENARKTGHNVARSTVNKFNDSKLKKKHDVNKQAFFMFPDGVTGSGIDILRGCQEILGSSFTIVGGSAGDDYMFEKTFQYFPNGIASNSVVGLLISGNLNVGVGLKHGWNPLGKYRKITKSTGNVIQEINNKPAISIYEEYFGEETKMLKETPLSMMGMLYPIGILLEEGEKEYIIRNPFKTTSEGELICTAGAPEGAKIRLMIGTRNNVLIAAREAALNALKDLGQKKPRFILMFSSISRKKLLGRNSYQEAKVVKNTIGKNIPLIGFYSYGEQGPLGVEKYKHMKKSHFHNEAIIVTIIGE